ncbi:zinc ABC transporter ATP-binding protein ZnuC [Polycladidibacter hongkongensis]|uniref:zinc ABC transporter ATP-binding protein ZnuC n=1 Tax=Polycladidibacter hongkongensis TaxID=1647556 RepID=UPI000835E7B4|nr:zinc ABC transporter ATP-binding protein ZnuC [Pseudovibrio hongkongensis]
MQLVSLDDIGVHRSGRWLVRNVSFDIKRGEIVSLIGPNGAGKSTCARVALGVMAANEGRVSRSARLKVGYVPQKLALDWTLPLSVERLMRLTERPSSQQIAAALERTGIAGMEKAPVQGLSGGEFQRALLARALLRSPNLLVLDEPVQGVDYGGELALYDLILQLREELDCGVLMISHDLHVVMAQTDSVVCLNGHVCCRGAPATVSGSQEFQQIFGEQAMASLALYQHNHDHQHLDDGRVVPADAGGCCGENHSHPHQSSKEQDSKERGNA